MNTRSVDQVEPEPNSDCRPRTLGGWGIADAVIVGAVGYAASVLSLILSMIAVYSIPSVHSFLQFYRLDLWVYVLAGVVGGIGFGGPLVMWFVRRRKFVSLAQSIYWECSNRVLGWALLVGFVSGIAYSLAKGMLAGRGYQIQPVEYIAACVVLAGLAQPAVEEIYFRGILFAALAGRFGDFLSIAAVTLLFCIAHPQHWFTVLPVSVLLGAMRLYTRSVKACFACHAAYNLALVMFAIPIIGN